MKNFITTVPFLIIFSLSAIASDLRIKFPFMEVFHAETGLSSDTLVITNAAGRTILSGRATEFEGRPFNLPAGTYKATLTYFSDETLPLEKEFIIDENYGATLRFRYLFNFGPQSETFENLIFSPRRPYFIWADSDALMTTIMLVSDGSVLVKPTDEIVMEYSFRSFYNDGESSQCLSALGLGRFAMKEVNQPLLRINNIATSIRIDKTDRVVSVGLVTIQIPSVVNFEIFSKDHANKVTLLTTCLSPDEEHSVTTFHGDAQLILPTGEYVIETLGTTNPFTVIEGKTTSLFF